MSELEIVSIATTLPGRAGDGTPEFVLTLAQAMRSDHVTIVAPRIRGGAEHEVIDGVRIRRVPYARSGRERLAEDAILPALRQSPRLALQLPRLLVGLWWAADRETARRRPDLLHAHWILPAGLLAMVIGRLRRVPFIVTAHGADAHALNGRLGRRIKRFVLRRALGVYPVSSEIEQLLRPLAPGSVASALPMGVDVDQLRHRCGPRAPQSSRLLFVGRLSDKKGVDVLLRSLAILDPHVELEIVGDGPDRAMLEALAADLGVAARVSFRGHCARQEVIDAYRSAGAVVIPSVTGEGGDRDGTPVVLMEALALGVPVVATDLGGIGEALTDDQDGLLVPERDVASLATAMQRIVTEHGLADRLAEAGVQTARQRFDVFGIAATMRGDVLARMSTS